MHGPVRERSEKAVQCALEIFRVFRFESHFNFVLGNVQHRIGAEKGGNTAETVCDGLHVTAMQVIGEVGPGIPRSVLLDGRWPGLPLITKAGGFGGPDEVREILEEISP